MNDKLPSNKHDNNNGHKARGTSRHKWLDGGSGAQGDKEPAPLRISARLTIPLLVRGALLAQGIPALTPPTGATAFGNEFYDDKMINLNDTLKTSRRLSARVTSSASANRHHHRQRRRNGKRFGRSNVYANKETL